MESVIPCLPAGRYPLNYGTGSIPQKYNQKPGFTSNSENLMKIAPQSDIKYFKSTINLFYRGKENESH
jgi:hypothetical protein